MSDPASGRVFISYRRQDARGSAGRIYDRLADRFGGDQVFMDVDAIALGVDFAEVITQAVSTCEVLLAVIGPRWLDAKDDNERRRLDDPGDFVRLEIAAALERNIRVIPILVEGAVMPRRQQLPENLAGLAGRNGLRVRHESFRSDTDQLLAAIEPILRVAAAAPVASPAGNRERQKPGALRGRRRRQAPAQRTVATSRMLLDRYEVGQLLGTGDMVEVYEGRDRLLDRRVAIRVLRAQFARDQSFLLRFKREAQAAASLSHPNSHPNIVGIHDIGSEDGTHFIVTEYVDGPTLKDIIQAEGPLDPQRAAAICACVCNALAVAHARGIIHHDIKPGNVIFTSDGKVKVMGFGMPRATSSVHTPEQVVSTADYISPEQAQGQTVDFRSDLYSLGCCLYEMLTGRVPFTGRTPAEIIFQHVTETPAPPRTLNPDVPAPLEAVCLKAMAKRPDDRYQTVTELHDDLGPFLNDQPVLVDRL
jgi:hypothetical protein